MKSRSSWLSPGAGMLALGIALSLACLNALLCNGFSEVLAWWLGLSLLVVWSAWRWLRQEQG